MLVSFRSDDAKLVKRIVKKKHLKNKNRERERKERVSFIRFIVFKMNKLIDDYFRNKRTEYLKQPSKMGMNFFFKHVLLFFYFYFHSIHNKNHHFTRMKKNSCIESRRKMKVN